MFSGVVLAMKGSVSVAGCSCAGAGDGAGCWCSSLVVSV